MEALELKGKDDAVAAYRLLDVAKEGRGASRRLDAPMVGREHERALLEQAYARAVRERSCHLFTVLGPAGVGKSRLAAEVIDSLPGASTLVGRCLPYGEGITFWPIVEIVRQAADLREDDAPDQAREKIESLLADSPEAPTIAERVAHAVGLPAAPASSEETFWGVRKLFEALAQPGPLVVVLDDLHWAEPTLLDLVEHVGDWARDAPILLLCLARSELLNRRPGWGGGKMNATAILLEPLTEEECDALVDHLLGCGASGSNSPPNRRSGRGQPSLRRGDAVDADRRRPNPPGKRRLGHGGRSRRGHCAADDPSASGCASRPARCRGARGDRTGCRRGKAVPQERCRRARAGGSAAESPHHLLTLQRKELIRPSRSDLAGDDAFRFRHLLIRDAAYDATPKQLRAELHERFAAWLELAAGERVREYEEILGYHLEQAYRYRRELGPPDEQARTLA